MDYMECQQGILTISVAQESWSLSWDQENTWFFRTFGIGLGLYFFI
jgi:hypothetical protein